jgi:anti-sigma-K factor RskA
VWFWSSLDPWRKVNALGFACTATVVVAIVLAGTYVATRMPSRKSDA